MYRDVFFFFCYNIYILDNSSIEIRKDLIYVYKYVKLFFILKYKYNFTISTSKRQLFFNSYFFY